MPQTQVISDIRTRLVQVGGRTSQEFGLGRIFGQVLVYLYFQEQECSLDQLGDDLGLSKASVSIAARQLESLGLLRRHWKKGDRKNYYSTADNIVTALQQGLLSFVRQKLRTVSLELEEVEGLVAEHINGPDTPEDLRFLAGRIKRARVLQKRATTVIDNPLVNFFLKSEQLPQAAGFGLKTEDGSDVRG